MVLPPGYLDSVVCSIVAGGELLGIVMLRLPYKASSDSVESERKNLATGLAISLGAVRPRARVGQTRTKG